MRLPACVTGARGVVDASGVITAEIIVPTGTAWRGHTVHAAFVILGPSGIDAVSPPALRSLTRAMKYGARLPFITWLNNLLLGGWPGQVMNGSLTSVPSRLRTSVLTAEGEDDGVGGVAAGGAGGGREDGLDRDVEAGEGCGVGDR